MVIKYVIKLLLIIIYLYLIVVYINPLI